MRKLHLVGVTSDLKGLIFSGRRGSSSGGYLVNIEDELIDAIADARRGSDGADLAQIKAALGSGGDGERKRSRPESTLTPREMQARLRAGRSIAEVAAEARVGAEWVERFAVPILAEQAKIVELARSLKFSKPRLGESASPLGKSVALNLADRGVMLPEDVFDAGWSAYQLHDSMWVVRFRYRSRGRLQEAAWELDAETGVIGHRNRLGSELGYVEATRRRRAKGQGAPVEKVAVSAADDGGRDLPSPSARGGTRRASRSSEQRPRPGGRSADQPARKSTGVTPRRPAKRANAAPADKRDTPPRARAGGTTRPVKERSSPTSPPRAPARLAKQGKTAVKRTRRGAEGPPARAKAPAPSRSALEPTPMPPPSGSAPEPPHAEPFVPPAKGPARERRPVISAQPVSRLVGRAGHSAAGEPTAAPPVQPSPPPAG